MLVFTVREPRAFYWWRTAFVIHVCLTDVINLSATPLVPSSFLLYIVPSMQAISLLRATRITFLALDYFSGARSAVVLAFQYNYPPFSTVFDNCRPGFFFPLFLRFLESCLSIFCVVVLFYLLRSGCCRLFWPSLGFAFFQHDHTIPVRRIL
jgi:hypothetical protein